ncbi:MAG: SUMF1/EgtB/PvdO family nonheme iron enzyme [Bernardetiaceae bacterium]|nr:SUMF1/EgtB/PvdO family nonheme iron enzyme [Bernardetiaceae bacterium]
MDIQKDFLHLFTEKYSVPNAIFAYYASWASLISPDYLQQLWRFFQDYEQNNQAQKLPTVVISDLLQSEHCIQIAYEIFEIDEDFAQALKTQFPQYAKEKNIKLPYQVKDLAAMTLQYAEYHYKHSHRRKLYDMLYWKAIFVLDPEKAQEDIKQTLKQNTKKGKDAAYIYWEIAKQQVAAKELSMPNDIGRLPTFDTKRKDHNSIPIHDQKLAKAIIDKIGLNKQEDLKPLHGGKIVFEKDYGEKWPLTVPYCEVIGKIGQVFIRVDEKIYGINGMAQQHAKSGSAALAGAVSIYEDSSIWKDNPEAEGTKIPISPLIEVGLKLIEPEERVQENKRNKDKKLDLSDCAIGENEKLLQDITKTKHFWLEILDLRNNLIEELNPDFLDAFPNLQELYLQGNPIKNLPKEILEQEGNQLREVCRYFKKNYVEVVSGVPFKMIYVEGGTFMMGYDPKRDGEDALEWTKEKSIPLHKLTLSDYYIAETEVTQKLWRAVMGSDPAELNNKGCDDCPVERVSWNDCKVFIEKLNTLTGKTFRLPTEAEWEFAARGGNKSKGYKYAGSDDIDVVAWYRENYKQSKHGSEGTTHPVKTKEANELGIYDMSGNVFEWCEDDWHDNYEGAPSDGSAWVDNPRASHRVLRGGSWFNFATNCRLAFRYFNTPDDRYGGSGFRLLSL